MHIWVIQLASDGFIDSPLVRAVMGLGIRAYEYRFGLGYKIQGIERVR